MKKLIQQYLIAWQNAKANTPVRSHEEELA